MELFLFRHEEYKTLYNCTGLDIEAIPLERRQFIPHAITSAILCAVFYVLYIPCMFSIWKHRHEGPCYQLLFFIGVMDCLVLWILGFLHSFLSLSGAVFCSHPTLIYVTGSLILAIERCLEILAPALSAKLFHGYKTGCWLVLCCIYGIYWLFFEKPVLFNGLFFAWFFNPFVGYREVPSEGKFDNKMQAVHDYIIGIAMPLIYVTFAVSFWCNFAKLQSTTMPRAQKLAFLQVFVFSAMNAVACFIYVMMQYVEPTQWLITLAQFAWLFIHGFPPVIYLLLNKTIRNDCIKMVYKVFDPKQIRHVHGITIIRGPISDLAKSKHSPEPESPLNSRSRTSNVFIGIG